MGPVTASPVLPPRQRPSIFEHHRSALPYRRHPKKRNYSSVPVARLFGPANFEASKLKVLFLGVDEKKHPGNLPRTYTLTHSDITSMLTLAISHSINESQVLSAFVHGDGHLLSQYPELQEALVWVYFHSNLPEFNRVECWGPLKDAVSPTNSGVDAEEDVQEADPTSNTPEWDVPPEPCKQGCYCCFTPTSTLLWSGKLHGRDGTAYGAGGVHQQSWSTEIVE